MAQQRMAIWAAEADLDEDVDLSLAIGNYGQNDHYEDGVYICNFHTSVDFDVVSLQHLSHNLKSMNPHS